MSRSIRHAFASDIHWDAELEPGIVIVHGFGLAISYAAKVRAGCILFQNVTLGLRQRSGDQARRRAAPRAERPRRHRRDALRPHRRRRGHENHGRMRAQLERSGPLDRRGARAAGGRSRPARRPARRTVYDGARNGLTSLCSECTSTCPRSSLHGSRLVALVACGGTGPYVWADSLPTSASGGGDVLIADGDVLNVRVFNQEPLSTKERVRNDGRISIPVIGEIVGSRTSAQRSSPPRSRSASRTSSRCRRSS